MLCAKFSQIFLSTVFSGVQEGPGQIMYPNGNLLEGTWNGGKRNGNFMFTFPNGEKYSGNYLAGVRQGTWQRI